MSGKLAMDARACRNRGEGVGTVPTPNREEVSTMSSKKRIAALATAAALAAGIPVAAATAAQAATYVYGTVAATAGLNLHSGSPTGTVIGAMPYQSTAQLYCWVYGPAITGPWGTTSVWDAVASYTPPGSWTVVFGPGTKVFSSDAWLNTGGDTSKMLPHC